MRKKWNKQRHIRRSVLLQLWVKSKINVLIRVGRGEGGGKGEVRENRIVLFHVPRINAKKYIAEWLMISSAVTKLFQRVSDKVSRTEDEWKIASNPDLRSYVCPNNRTLSSAWRSHRNRCIHDRTIGYRGISRDGASFNGILNMNTIYSIHRRAWNLRITDMYN